MNKKSVLCNQNFIQDDLNEILGMWFVDIFTDKLTWLIRVVT